MGRHEDLSHVNYHPVFRKLSTLAILPYLSFLCFKLNWANWGICPWMFQLSHQNLELKASLTCSGNYSCLTVITCNITKQNGQFLWLSSLPYEPNICVESGWCFGSGPRFAFLLCHAPRMELGPTQNWIYDHPNAGTPHWKIQNQLLRK